MCMYTQSVDINHRMLPILFLSTRTAGVGSFMLHECYKIHVGLNPEEGLE